MTLELGNRMPFITCASVAGGAGACAGKVPTPSNKNRTALRCRIITSEYEPMLDSEEVGVPLRIGKGMAVSDVNRISVPDRKASANFNVDDVRIRLRRDAGDRPADIRTETVD